MTQTIANPIARYTFEDPDGGTYAVEYGLTPQGDHAWCARGDDGKGWALVDFEIGERDLPDADQIEMAASIAGHLAHQRDRVPAVRMIGRADLSMAIS